MFPSILKSRSRTFNTTDGTYSSEQGRRLRTVARDWNNISERIQSGAEAMTPARLSGYERFRFARSHLAYLEPVTSPTEPVTIGFLIFGFSSEALACLDHLYEKDGPGHLFEDATKSTMTWRETKLKRQNVTVCINATSSDNVNIDAVTYVVVDNKHKRATERKPWDIN